VKKAFRPLSLIVFWSATAAGLVVGGFAAAQEPAAPSSGAATPGAATPGASKPKSSAQIDAGEPRAGTSSPAPAPVTPLPGKAAPASPSAARAPKAGAQKPPGGVDRLDLNTATVTGDREQPKVMYIVPWKSSDMGDLSGRPMNSLLDEALAPVDRDEFKREVAYFNAVKADRSQNGTSNGTSKQGEK
jgi:hypothetical protein